MVSIWGSCRTSDAAEYISEGVHGGSHLARHHCSGEQLVQLNQFVGCSVKLERNAVQRVPRFHLDHKTRERTQNHTPAWEHIHKAVQGRLEDVTQMMRDWKRCTFIILKGFNGTWFLHVRFWDVMQIKAVSCWPGIDSHGKAVLLVEMGTDMNVSSSFVLSCKAFV